MQQDAGRAALVPGRPGPAMGCRGGILGMGKARVRAGRLFPQSRRPSRAVLAPGSGPSRLHCGTGTVQKVHRCRIAIAAIACSFRRTRTSKGPRGSAIFKYRRHIRPTRRDSRLPNVSRTGGGFQGTAGDSRGRTWQQIARRVDPDLRKSCTITSYEMCRHGFDSRRLHHFHDVVPVVQRGVSPGFAEEICALPSGRAEMKSRTAEHLGDPLLAHGWAERGGVTALVTNIHPKRRTEGGRRHRRTTSDRRTSGWSNAPSRAQSS
jgi:hypothetical protein